MGAGRQQLSQRRRRIQHLLDIVQRHQEPSVAQRYYQPIRNGPSASHAHAQCVRNRGERLSRVAYRRQRHKDHIVGKVRAERPRDLKRKPCLADTRRAGERQQAHVLSAQQMDERGLLALAPNEWRRWDREVRRDGRGQ